MKGFIATLIATGVALWVAARFVPGIEIPSASFAKVPEDLISFGIVALVFGIVNGMIGPLVKALSMPFNLFTMGLFGIVLNMVLFLGAAYASDQIGGREGPAGNELPLDRTPDACNLGDTRRVFSVNFRSNTRSRLGLACAFAKGDGEA